ncbi:hypothetical protein ACFL0H_08505 [Thermodesulfobacteriota bacterium]
MKKIALTLFVLMFCISYARADDVDDALGREATDQLRASTRQMINFGIDKEDTIRMTRTMIRNRFQQEQVIRAQNVVMETRRNGLPTDPVMSKALEGMAKRVEANKIIQAMERVRNRYAVAHGHAAQLTSEPTRRQTLTRSIAEGMTAGMAEGDVKRLMTQIRERRTQMDRKMLGDLAAESFGMARDMARRRVSSDKVTEVVGGALRNRYSTRKMRQLRRSFMENGGNMDSISRANRFGDTFERGTGARDISPGSIGGGAGQGGSGGPAGGFGGGGSGGGSGGRGR